METVGCLCYDNFTKKVTHSSDVKKKKKKKE